MVLEVQPLPYPTPILQHYWYIRVLSVPLALSQDLHFVLLIGVTYTVSLQNICMYNILTQALLR